MCRMVLDETGLLPHPNAGILGVRELTELREVSASQGMMLETVSERLCGPGGPHEHAPDKRPLQDIMTCIREKVTLAEAPPVLLPTSVQTKTVTDYEAGMRVDRFFESKFKGLSFSHIQRIVRKGEVRVDGKRVDADDAPGVVVPAGSTLTFTYEVTNTRALPLTRVKVTDDKGVSVDCGGSNTIALLTPEEMARDMESGAAQVRGLKVARQGFRGVHQHGVEPQVSPSGRR